MGVILMSPFCPIQLGTPIFIAWPIIIADALPSPHKPDQTPSNAPYPSATKKPVSS